MDKNPAYTKKHWILLIFTMLMIGSSLGLLTNGNGVFYLPMARTLDVPLGSISMHTTFKSLASAFTALTIPKMVENFGIKKVIALGVVLAAVSTGLLSIIQGLPALYILGIIRGIGFSYYSLVPMSMILNHWFDRHNGLAIGLASASSGVFASIFAPILTFIIEAVGWRNAFIFKGIMIFVLVLPILLLPFKLDPRDEGLLPYGYREKKDNAYVRKADIKEVSPTNPVFIIFMVVGFLTTFVMYINSHFPAYGESVGLSPEVAALILSGTMLGNIVWKMLFGAMSDRIGAISASTLMYGIGFLSLLLMVFGQHPALLILAGFLFGAVFSISGVGLPLLSNEFFGPVAGGNVYSKVSFMASFGGALGVGITGFIYDYSDSYIPAFTIMLALLAVNAILILLARKFHQKELVL